MVVDQDQVAVDAALGFDQFSHETNVFRIAIGLKVIDQVHHHFQARRRLLAHVVKRRRGVFGVGHGRAVTDGAFTKTAGGGPDPHGFGVAHGQFPDQGHRILFLVSGNPDAGVARVEQLFESLQIG